MKKTTEEIVAHVTGSAKRVRKSGTVNTDTGAYKSTPVRNTEEIVAHVTGTRERIKEKNAQNKRIEDARKGSAGPMILGAEIAKDPVKYEVPLLENRIIEESAYKPKKSRKPDANQVSQGWSRASQYMPKSDYDAMVIRTISDADAARDENDEHIINTVIYKNKYSSAYPQYIGKLNDEEFDRVYNEHFSSERPDSEGEAFIYDTKSTALKDERLRRVKTPYDNAVSFLDQFTPDKGQEKEQNADNIVLGKNLADQLEVNVTSTDTPKRQREEDLDDNIVPLADNPFDGFVEFLTDKDTKPEHTLDWGDEETPSELDELLRKESAPGADGVEYSRDDIYKNTFDFNKDVFATPEDKHYISTEERGKIINPEDVTDALGDLADRKDVVGAMPMDTFEDRFKTADQFDKTSGIYRDLYPQKYSYELEKLSDEELDELIENNGHLDVVEHEFTPNQDSTEKYLKEVKHLTPREVEYSRNVIITYNKLPQREQAVLLSGASDTAKINRLISLGYDKETAERVVDYSSILVNEQEHQKMVKDIEDAGFLKLEGYNAAAFLTNLLSFVGQADLTYQAKRNLFSDTYRPVDYYTPLTAPGRFARETRKEKTERIDNEFLRNAYGLGTSMLDSALTMPLALLGPLGAGASRVIMSGSAGLNAVYDAKERGASDYAAVNYGIAASISEAMFESLSIGSFVDIFKKDAVESVLKKLVVQGFVEGSEETMTSLANAWADEIINGDKSEFNDNVKKYIEAGKSEEEAHRLALDNYIASLGIDFVGGFISGGIFGSAGTAINNAIQKSKEHKANKIENDLISRQTAGMSAAEKDMHIKGMKAAKESIASNDASSESDEIEILDNENKAYNEARVNVARQSLLSSGADVETAEFGARAIVNALDGKLSRTEAVEIAKNQELLKAYNYYLGTDITASENAASEVLRVSEARKAAEVQRREALVEKMSGMSDEAIVAFEKAGVPAEYADDFLAYYTAGLAGSSLSEANRQNKSLMPKTFKELAMHLGRADMNPKSTRAVYATNPGFAENEYSASVDSETKTELDRIGKDLGVSIEMGPATGDSGDNGFYSAGRIVIAEDAADPFRVVAAHEVTHRLFVAAYKEARAYSEYVTRKMYSRGTLNSAVDDIITKRKANGYELTRAEAVEEIVSNYTKRMLDDVDLFYELAHKKPNIAKRLLYGFKEFLSKIKSKFTGNKNLDSYGLSHSELRRAAKLWSEAYNRAVTDAAKTADNKNTAVDDSGDDGEFSYFDDYEDDIESESDVKHSVKDGGSTDKYYDYSKNDFASQIDDYLKHIGKARKKPQRDSFLIGGTPKVFTDIGFNALPVTINKTHIDYAVNGTKDFDHEVFTDVLKDLPEALKSPIMVMESDALHNRAVAVLKIKAKNGKKLYLPIEIDGTATSNGIRIDSNAVTSLLGKTNVEKKMLNALNNEAQGKINVFYWNKKEACALLQRGKHQLPTRLPQDGFVHSIRENGSNVKVRLNNVTESLQFVRWFGDWQNDPENASKIVNSDGTPKIMYHGSREQFTVFDKKKAKASGYYGKGFYFTDSESNANLYGNLYSVYLNVKHPLENGKTIISTEQIKRFLSEVAENEDYSIENYGTYNISDILKNIQSRDAFSVIQDINATAIGDFVEAIKLFNEVNGTKFDGIVTPTETVVFEPNQIKSATDNIGTFDARNADIRYSSKTDPSDDTNSEYRGYDGAVKLASERVTKRKTFGIISEEGADALSEYTGVNRGEISKLISIYKKAYEQKHSDRIDTVNQLVARTYFVVNMSVMNDFGIDSLEFTPELKRYVDEMAGIIVDRITRKDARNSFGESVNKNRGLVSVYREAAKRAQTEAVMYKKQAAEVKKRHDSAVKRASQAQEREAKAIRERNEKLLQARFEAKKTTLLKLMDRLFHAKKVSPEFKAKIAKIKKDFDLENFDTKHKRIERADTTLIHGLKQIYSNAVSLDSSLYSRDIDSIIENTDGLILAQLSKEEAKALSSALKTLKSSGKLTASKNKVISEYIEKLDNYKPLTGTSKNLNALKEIYEELVAENPDFQDTYIEGIIGTIDSKHIDDLDEWQINALTKVLSKLAHDIKLAQTDAFVGMDEMPTVTDAALAEINVVRNAVAFDDIENKWGRGKRSAAAEWSLNAIANNFLTPESGIKRLTGYNENSFLLKLTRALDDGQLEVERYKIAAEEKFSKFTENKKFMDSLYKKKVTVDGHDIPLGFAISLYLHSKNDDNMRHIERGGISLPNFNAFTRKINYTNAKWSNRVRLTKAKIESMARSFTNEEIAFANEVADYFDHMNKDAINKISVLLNGYEKADVTFYFPISTDKNFMTQSFIVTPEGGLPTFEFPNLKDRRLNAGNPALLFNVVDVLARSVENTSMYYGLAVPMHNFKTLYNSTVAEHDTGIVSRIMGAEDDQNYVARQLSGLAEEKSLIGVQSLKDTIERKWGKDGKEFIDDFLIDLGPQNKKSGKVRDFGDKAVSWIMGNYAKNALTLNLSSTFIQTSGLMAAGSVLDIKNVTKAYKTVLTGPKAKKLDELIKKHTPMLEMRKKGYSEMELGDVSNNFKKSAVQNAYDNIMSHKALDWMTDMDLWTARRVWVAAEYHTKANYKHLEYGSEAYYKQVAKSFNEAIRKTQPNSTAMERPRIMRRNSAILSFMTFFKSQAFANFNCVYDALNELRVTAFKMKYTTPANSVSAITDRKAKIKQLEHRLGNVLAAQVLQQLITELMRFGVKMLRGDRDDYEEEDGLMTLNSALSGIAGNFAVSMFEPIPFISTLANAIDSASKYGPDKLYQVFMPMYSERVEDVLENTFKFADSLKNEDGEYNFELFGKQGQKMVESLATFWGVPVSNLKKDLNLIPKLFAEINAGGGYAGDFAVLGMTGELYYTDNKGVKRLSNEGAEIAAYAYYNDPESYAYIIGELEKSGCIYGDKIRQKIKSLYREGKVKIKQ